MRSKLRNAVAASAVAACLSGVIALGNPHFLLDNQAEWEEARAAGKIQPLTSAQWAAYMAQWGAYRQQGDNYPTNVFRPPMLPTGELYVYPGGGDGWPEDAGLVMCWQPLANPGNYSSCWRYDYQVDPDLSNVTITVTATPKQFGITGQINVISLGIEDMNGNIRSWYWNCGPGGLPWNVPTVITVNTALTGVTAATPTANAYMSNPGINLVNTQFLLFDENLQWVGGPIPAPPPGGQIPGAWNYWHNLIVSPNITAKMCEPMKWTQPVVEYRPGLNPPLFYGWDERSDYNWGPPIVADDWLCTTDKPVTDIHWWGSFVGWSQPYPPPLPAGFHIGIWTDVPSGPNQPFSHPGTLIWQNFCTTYRWNFAGYDRSPQMPTTDWNESCFQFNQDLKPEEYFYQQPGPTGQNVFWLSIAAIYPGQPQFPWGWKTRPHYFNDDAVRIWATAPTWPPNLGAQWVEGQPIEYPNGTSWDLAFELSTKKKWNQSPDLSTDGIDVKATLPNVLADDFLCTEQTLITDVTVWGSWLNDQLPGNNPSNVTFTLSLHADIPDPDGDGPGYSRPGDTLWQRTFQPGTFTARRYAEHIDEGWWDPSQPTSSYIFPGDHVCWEYNFLIPPSDAFCQRGSPDNPVVYWLDLQATPLVAGGGCVQPDNGTGTADLPPVGCEYPTPNGDMHIVDGLPAGTTIEIDATHKNFVCSPGGSVCSFPPGVTCRQPGGSLGGEKECFDSQLDMPMVGTGALLGFNRLIAMPVSFEAHTAPRTLGAPVQSFNTDMFRMFGQITGDPDFDLLRIVAGTDFGLPSPGHTTLTQQPGGWAVDSFFDITYRIDFVGAPGGSLAGRSGSTTGTVRFQIAAGGPMAEFGWKTSQCHWNDDAVWGQGQEPYPGPWGEMHYPPQHRLFPRSLDLAFAIDGDLPCVERDWGDAPDQPYPTLSANAGANHLIVPGMFLGAFIDAEPDGQPNAAATGDDLAGVDDEDGVVFLTPLKKGKVATVQVTASIAGRLDAWIDYNQNGSWADPGEQIFASAALAAGVNNLSFLVPKAAKLGRTASRWRYSTAGGLPFTGPALDGEVEDYVVTIKPAKVVGHWIFYNASYFDGNNAAPNAADDGAIATDKSALMPGGAGSFANYISKGINGIMVDIEDLAGTPTAADFAFINAGRDATGAGAAAVPSSITVRPGAGTGGSDRVTIIWAGSAVPNSRWLKTRVLATDETGLESADTFYFGEAIGEGNSISGANAIVNATDEIGARNNPHTTFNRAPIDDWYDYNRDSVVNATDQLISRNNFTTSFSCLVLPGSAQP